MKKGDISHAWIDYNSVTQELDVRLSDGADARPANAQLGETIDLDSPSILGSSPNVYAGFTSVPARNIMPRTFSPGSSTQATARFPRLRLRHSFFLAVEYYFLCADGVIGWFRQIPI
jgi:hypothetical protein